MKKIFPIAFMFLYLSACSNGGGNKGGQAANSPKPMTESQKQLAEASFSSEEERQALSKFITGSEFCKKFENITSKENGFYVDVPVDYSDLTKGKTKVWAFTTSGPIDPAKPSFIYFDGGSGGNSHNNPQIVRGFNEIHFDQRGIGCSHPEKLSLYRDPDFYSNENNARDADEIRKFLKIDKVTVYGTSYGTVVATVYASIFPDSTRAVVLDGTVLGHDRSDESNAINFYLRKTYNELPEGTKLGLKNYINSQDDVLRLWMLAKMFMYMNKPFDLLKKVLTRAFPDEHTVNHKMADRFFGRDVMQDAFYSDDISGIEGFNNAILTCKNYPKDVEMTVLLFGPYAGTYFELTPYKINSSRREMCARLGVDTTRATAYDAPHYKFSAPVTYFQGNQDSATVASNAIRHYKEVPTGFKQIMIAVGGGHCPGYSSVMPDENHIQNVIAQDVMESALLGKKLNKNQVDSLNRSQQQLSWKYAGAN